MSRCDYWFEVRWRPRRVWWHRAASGRHATFKGTRRARQRAAEKRFVLQQGGQR